jgi:hypothetical protein
VGEDDPLFEVRLIRNAVEHFDERLDRFCTRDPLGTIFDLIVESNELVDQQVTHVLRLVVDPEAEIIVLFGKNIPLLVSKLPCEGFATWPSQWTKVAGGFAKSQSSQRLRIGRQAFLGENGLSNLIQRLLLTSPLKGKHHPSVRKTLLPLVSYVQHGATPAVRSSSTMTYGNAYGNGMGTVWERAEKNLREH